MKHMPITTHKTINTRALQESLKIPRDINVSNSRTNGDSNNDRTSSISKESESYYTPFWVDSKLRFKIDQRDRPVSCRWVANRDTERRCNFEGVADTCPFTCDNFFKCVDSPLRLKFFDRKKVVNRYCTWVGEKNSQRRCNIKHIRDTCKVTCGRCSSGKHLPLNINLYFHHVLITSPHIPPFISISQAPFRKIPC